MNWFKLSQIMQESYNFVAGEQKAESMSDAELAYAIKDLKEVINVQEESSRKGMSVPKLGYYWDELHTYLREQNKRKDAKGNAIPQT